MKRILKSNYTQSTTAYLNYETTLTLFHLGFEHEHVTAVYWNEGDHCLEWMNDKLQNSSDEFVVDYKENIFEKSMNIGHIIPAISLEDAVNFFRTEYSIYIMACPLLRVSKGTDTEDKGYYSTNEFIWRINRFNDDNKLIGYWTSNMEEFQKQTYCSYQAALEAGINEVIHIIKNEVEPELPFEPKMDDELPF